MPVMAVAFYNTIMLIAIGGYVALFVWNAKKQKKKKNLILFPVLPLDGGQAKFLCNSTS